MASTRGGVCAVRSAVDTRPPGAGFGPGPPPAERPHPEGASRLFSRDGRHRPLSLVSLVSRLRAAGGSPGRPRRGAPPSWGVPCRGARGANGAREPGARPARGSRPVRWALLPPSGPWLGAPGTPAAGGRGRNTGSEPLGSGTGSGSCAPGPGLATRTPGGWRRGRPGAAAGRPGGRSRRCGDGNAGSRGSEDTIKHRHGVAPVRKATIWPEAVRGFRDATAQELCSGAPWNPAPALCGGLRAPARDCPVPRPRISGSDRCASHSHSRTQ